MEVSRRCMVVVHKPHRPPDWLRSAQLLIFILEQGGEHEGPPG
eukprot:CAMPEP_0174703070 /NCGR_PEP_ID=MMETSP1094-20130205/7145_1 /TAXON_ID=156173 /ORGANISM="Chrysochromulina brevifilum, Strain UTEX LB 985" /LENGTH=42 /DNA_ID= /DNA_START= /DNA_END= /DNA_ORIENTATION=